MRGAFFCVGLILSGCIVVQTPPRNLPPPAPPPIEESPPPVVEQSVYLEPPIEAPPPVAIRCAPPPMRVEPPPPIPYPGAVWVGGYWHWGDGQWVWFLGRWTMPPQPQYVWVSPYYENRSGLVIYVAGHWSREARYTPPSPTMYIPVSEPRPGYVTTAPLGPNGVFVPPPPGSRTGLIVPAPIGTPPAVVVSAPPVVRPGMVIQKTTNTFNTTNVTNVTNVTVIAPAGVTQTGRPVRTTVPAEAHAAAGLPPVVRAPPPAPAPSTASFHPEHPEHPEHPAHPEHPGRPDSFAQPAAPNALPPASREAAPPNRAVYGQGTQPVPAANESPHSEHPGYGNHPVQSEHPDRPNMPPDQPRTVAASPGPPPNPKSAQTPERVEAAPHPEAHGPGQVTIPSSTSVKQEPGTKRSPPKAAASGRDKDKKDKKGKEDRP